MSETETDVDQDRVLAAIRRSVAVVVPEIEPADVAPGRTLSELGCNSIDRAEVVTLAMEELGITVPVTELGEVGDVGSLVELLRRHA